MKYFVLLAANGEVGSFEEMTPDQMQAVMAKHEAFDTACAERDGVQQLGGEALGDGSMATTIRTSGGEFTVTDGPFAEAAEQIGGYYLIDAPDLDTITDLCRVLPPYVIEIRPALDVG